MKTTLLFFLLLNSSAYGQWKKIADFQTLNQLGECCYGEPITCVYFLDLPGPPRIGFVGTESELYKTTDAGNSWTCVWDSGKTYDSYYIPDICFKDSLTGWFSIFNVSGATADIACYRTTDGGDTWKPIEVAGSITGSDGIYYCSSINRLFLSMTDTGMKVSTDLGETWQLTSSIEAGGISFSNDSMGIAAAYPPYGDFDHGIMRTTDGGLTWNLVETSIWCHHPLAIPNTPTCFAIAEDSETVFYRSDDYGNSWKRVYNFGPETDSFGNRIGPSGTGIIRGDLSRLYIQSDSGMYVSTDEGITWKNDGGPQFIPSGCNDLFYSAKGITIAGAIANNGRGGLFEGDGLWEEIWPQAGLAESAATNSVSGLRVFPNPASGELQILGCEVGEIHLFDIMGRERMNAVVDGSGATLDVARLEDGIYFVRLGDQSAKVNIAH